MMDDFYFCVYRTGQHGRQPQDPGVDDLLRALGQRTEQDPQDTGWCRSVPAAL